MSAHLIGSKPTVVVGARVVGGSVTGGWVTGGRVTTVATVATGWGATVVAGAAVVVVAAPRSWSWADGWWWCGPR